jgi:hypothetical protein
MSRLFLSSKLRMETSGQVRNALSPSHLAAMNAVVAQRLTTVDFGAAAQQRTPPGSSRRMAGSGRPDLDLMQLSAAERQPVVELLAHPALVQRRKSELCPCLTQTRSLHLRPLDSISPCFHTQSTGCWVATFAPNRWGG